jgi:hypothetical protein
LFLGQLQKAAIFHAVGCRLMASLGANTIKVPPMNVDEMEQPNSPWRAVNQLRVLFWLNYWQDKEICLRTGQPPSINDDDCDLTLPHGYVGIKYIDDAVQLSPSDDAAIPILAGDVRLDILKSKAYKLLYSAKALRKSDVELIKDIRRLDDALEEWRLSVPAKFRPSLCLREHKNHSDLSPVRAMERLMIQLEYRNLMAKVHHATGRCRLWHDRNNSELGGVSSSLALAVEASRSTLFYLRGTAHALMGEVFWYVSMGCPARVAVFMTLRK